MTDAEILSALIAGGFTLFLICGAIAFRRKRTMSDAEIAAKLTKAHWATLWVIGRHGASSRHVCRHLARPLIRRGYVSRIERPGFSTWYELTSAGRALLKETSNG